MQQTPSAHGNDSGVSKPGGSSRKHPEVERDSSLIVLSTESQNSESILSPSDPNTDDSPTIITSAKPFTPTDPSLGLKPGSRLGHYELISAIGAGGMASVLKARDLDLGRDVALKILPPHMARDSESVARFKHEARAAAQLDHDNIARVFACGEENGLHFIAFEFIEGVTLRALIDRHTVLTAVDSVRYMMHVTAGLAHAAERGVVHRDIKPSNIIITPDGRAKIVDMGLARSLNQPIDGGVTQSGVTLGTFDYISPEQAMDARRADVRSDIYSLGCTMYHALTGRPPVPEGSPIKKLHAHQHEAVTDPRVLNPSVPDELAIILSKMMAKDVNRRFQTPGELIAALSALAQKLNVGFTTETMPALNMEMVPDQSAVRLIPEPPRVSLGLILGGAAVLIAVVLIFGFSGSPSPTQDRPPWEAATRATATTPTTREISQPVPSTPNPVVSATRMIVGETSELLAALRNPDVTEIQLRPGATYDLTTDAVGVLVSGCSQLVLEGLGGERSDQTPVIRLLAAPDRGASPRAGSLAIADCESVKCRGIRWEIVGQRDADRAAGLLISGAAKVEFVECRFGAEADSDRGTSFANVSIRRDSGAPTQASFQHCYFGRRRGTGVTLVGSVNADVMESAFAPHTSVFTLRNQPSSATASVKLLHSTFLMEKGAVVEANETSRGRIEAGFCVFATPPTAATDPTETDLPVIVRELGESPGATRFQGTGDPNAYYRVQPYALDLTTYTFPDAMDRWPESPVLDPGAIDLQSQSPWASETGNLTARLRGATPWDAFRLNPALTPLRKVPSKVSILGVRELPRKLTFLYPTWPPDLGKTKIWYPDPKPEERENFTRNYYFETLQSAVVDLQSGDELQLMFDGARAIPDLISFPSKPNLKVTLKPAPGSSPILELDANKRFDPTLFKLTEGEVTFEGLEFRVRKRPGDDLKTMSLITLVAGKQCVFRNCVFTLVEEGSETISIVALSDPSGEMMRTATNAVTPKVVFENCLIRGKGRALWVQSARPFDLDVKITVTALRGPVIVVDPATKPSQASGIATVRFDRITSLLGGTLLDLHPGRPVSGTKPNGWVPLEIRADRSLFVMHSNDAPLVLVDGGDPQKLKDSFTWNSANANWYANLPPSEKFLDVLSYEETGGTKIKSWNAKEWFLETNEDAATVTASVEFAQDLSEIADSSWKAITAAALRVRMSSLRGDVGAAIDLIPKPIASPRPE